MGTGRDGRVAETPAGRAADVPPVWALARVPRGRRAWGVLAAQVPADRDVSTDEPVRMRGRALQRARAELFARAPWCITCEMDGRQTRATIRNHIVSLADGGTDDVANTQGLCLDCWEKQKEEEVARGLPRPSLTHAFRKSAVPRTTGGHFTARRATVRPDALLAGRDEPRAPSPPRAPVPVPAAPASRNTRRARSR